MATAPTRRAAQPDAAQALYERYYPNVYRYALSQLRSPQDAEDAAQNTFLRAFAALQKGVVPENETAWLFKIAHNVCASSKLAWLRRRRVETPRDLDLLPVTPATPESRRDELAGLEDALASMPPRLREAFLMREWQGLSYAEIAEQLDTSRSAVETLIFRARKMLAQQLEQPVRRVREALGVGPLLGFFRGLLQGTPAVVKTVGALAVLAGAGVAVPELVVPSHSPRPAGTMTLPVAPAIAQSTPRAARPAAASHRPVRHQATARTAPPGMGTSAAAPPSAPAAAPAQQPASEPAASKQDDAAPASATPAGTVAATTTAVTQRLPPPLETPPLPSLTVPALPPTPPLESPPVPPVSIPDLPTVPTVTVPTQLP